MTKIFKANIESLEKRLEEAAHVNAHNIVEQLKKSTYANSAGHYSISLYPQKTVQEQFWREVVEAHRKALLAEVSSEIERYGIELMKRKAAEWEQAAKGNEK